MTDHPRTALEESALYREFALLVRHRKPVLINLALVVLLAVAYSLLTPKLYDARASLLPVTEEAGALGGLSALLRELPIQGANLPGVTTSTDLLSAMLHSRRIQEPVVRELDFQTRYKAKTFDHALATFDAALETEVSDEGILRVRFRDREPEVAARVVNRLVQELDAYNIEASTTRSRLVGDFVENRLADTRASLDSAEARLRDYQKDHAIAISPEDMAAAETVGGLIARKLTLQVELDALSEFIDPKSPPVLQRQGELRALDREISGLPELGLQAVRLYRDYKVQEQAFLFLRAQLEQARIDERRDLSRVQVLDVATPPVLRSWPRRKVIVLSAMVMAFGMSVLLAHALEFWHRASPDLRRMVSRPPA
jgi:uncharacterized protein involved in exopolysaccharide biosynthesis